MDLTALDDDLTALVEKKNTLSKMDYSDETYDEEEERLHTMEDKLMENYGGYLEDAFNDVHDEFCPDTAVLVPIAYLPKRAMSVDNNGYEVDFTQGIYVEIDDYPGKETKFVLLPKPTRILLQIDEENKEVVWTAK